MTQKLTKEQIEKNENAMTACMALTFLFSDVRCQAFVKKQKPTNHRNDMRPKRVTCSNIRMRNLSMFQKESLQTFAWKANIKQEAHQLLGSSEGLQCQLKFRDLWTLTSFYRSRSQTPLWHCWTCPTDGYIHTKISFLVHWAYFVTQIHHAQTCMRTIPLSENTRIAFRLKMEDCSNFVGYTWKEK